MWSAQGFRFENKLCVAINGWQDAYFEKINLLSKSAKMAPSPSISPSPPMNLSVWSLWGVSETCTIYFFLPYKLWSSGLTNWTPSVDSTCHLRPATITEWSTKITPSLKLKQSRWRVKVTITAFQPGMRAWRRISKSLLLVLLYSRASKRRAVWSLTLNTL